MLLQRNSPQTRFAICHFRGGAVRVLTSAILASLWIAGCGDPGSVGGPTGLATDVQELPITTNSDLVISQVYGGGGNSGAPFNADFVEIFNRANVPVSLVGWSVQYASATGTGNFSSNPVIALSGTLQPGQYYLVQLASGANGAALPTPDVTGSIALSGSAGKVALVNSATGVTCNGGSNPCNATQLASIVDLVGYGTANFFEGAAAAAALTTSTAALRAGSGCVDTNANSADFTAVTPTPRNTSSPLSPCLSGVVISQVYGGGGNSGAPYNSDFIELFNRSASAVSLSGWSLQYASAAGSTWSVVALSGSIPAQGYFLLQAASGVNGVALPTPDQSASTALGSTSGKVALVNNTTALTCASCGGNGSILDFVGYGSTASYFEGTGPTPILSNTTAALRAGGGCSDANDNAFDFTAGAPVPRNSASPSNACSANTPPGVVSTVPSNGATNIAVGVNLSVQFSESVNLAGNWLTLNCSTSGAVTPTVSGGPTTFTLDPPTDLAPAESCTLTVIASAVTDLTGLAMTANYVATFSTAVPGGVTPIHTIQGASHLSPLNGAAVTTRGIVTALASNGYYLQDPAPDASDATSEAIFVFTSTAPSVAVGDDVQVTATVSEYRPGCNNCAPSSSAYPNLTLTELISPTVQSVLASGQPLPAALVVGAGGRTPPTSVIEDDAVGAVEVVAGTFDPSNDGLDFWESLESMRLQVNDAVAVGPTATFSGGSLELPVLADNGAAAGLRTARGGVVIASNDYNPERIHLANELTSALPAANVGDSFPGAIVGVLGYSFANYKLFTTQPLPALVASGVNAETLSFGSRTSFDLDVAAFNVENLDALDPASKFSQLASILVNNLNSPDLVALEEIQDNDGATNSGTVNATTTLNALTAAISSAGGPSYSYRSIDPVDGQDGGEPGGNIRVVFLYRTDRGLSFVDRAGASSLTPNSVIGTGSATRLQYSPGRLDPTNSAFSSSRKPLAGEFTFQGRTFFVIANHFNSKGGDQPLFGRFQPPTLSSETQRLSQANVVRNFVQQLLAADPNAGIVTLGDLNDFEFSAPLISLKSAGLSALIETLPANERYTYVYQGNSQALDHLLVSSALQPHVLGYDVVHVNSEFANQASDHDPGVARLSFDYAAPLLTGPAGGSLNVTATGPSGATVHYPVTASDNRDGALPVQCSPASGSVFPVGTHQVTCLATDANGNVGQLSFSVTISAAAAAVPWGPQWRLWVLAGGLLVLGAGMALRLSKAAA